MSFSGLMQTKSTLKWFIVIGIIIVILGFIISFVNLVGIIIAWIGILLIAFSIIVLFYLWFTERYLPQPTMDRVTIRRQ